MDKWAYQQRCIEQIVSYLLSERTCVLLAACVASGKTRMSLAVATVALQQRAMSHVVVIAPSKGIEGQYAHSSGTPFRYLNRDYHVNEVLEREVKGRAADIIPNYLYRSNEGRQILVTSYPAFRKWLSAPIDVTQKLDLTKVLLIIDEAHHVSSQVNSKSTQISDAVQRFRRHGGLTLKLTGTPERADSRPVYDDSEKVIARSLVQHMTGGCTPKHLYSEVLELPGTSQKDADVYGAPQHQFEREGFIRIAEHILREGKPKSIIRLKHGTTVDNNRRVKALREVLECRGISTLVAYPTTEDEGDTKHVCTADLERYYEVIQTENRGTTYSANDVPDVIVSFIRIGEGINLPSRSHVYFWGIPKSMPFFQQVLGRVLRLRLDDDHKPIITNYPSRWLDNSKVVLCVAETAQFEHSEHDLFLIGLVSHLGMLEQTSWLRELTRVFDGLPSWEAEEGSSAKGVDTPDQKLWDAIPEERINWANDVMHEAWLWYRQRRSTYDDTLKVADLVQLAEAYARNYQEYEPNQEDREALRILCAGYRNPTSEDEERIQRVRSQRYNDVHEYFQAIFQEFAEETAVPTQASQRLLRGETLSWYVTRLANLRQASQPKSLADILSRVEAFRKSEGRLPRYGDADPTYTQWTYGGYDRYMRGKYLDENPQQETLAAIMLRQYKQRRQGVAAIRYLLAMAKQHDSEEVKRLPTVRYRKTSLATRLATLGARYPEMAVFPNAWRAFHAGYNFESQLTLEQAEEIGKRKHPSPARMAAREIVVQSHGLPYLIEKLQAKEEL